MLKIVDWARACPQNATIINIANISDRTRFLLFFTAFPAFLRFKIRYNFQAVWSFLSAWNLHNSPRFFRKVICAKQVV
jgi:hypothetical protein